MNWPVLADGGGVSNLYHVMSTPSTFVIAPNGTIRDAWFFTHENVDEAFQKSMREVATESKCEAPPVAIRPNLNFDVLSPENKKVSLSSISSPLHLVHFWATWCGPCQKELPELLKFVEETPQVKLTLISVEDAEDGPRIERYLKSYGARWKSYRAPAGGVASEINMGYSVPRTYLLNQKGEVLRPFYGVQKWKEESLKDRILSWRNWK